MRRATFAGAAVVVFLLSFAAHLLRRYFQNDTAESFGMDIQDVGKSQPELDIRGWAECHLEGRSCHFANVLETSDGLYIFVEKMRRSFTRWSGLLLAEGIGSPGNYYYIDSWSMMPSRQRHPIEAKLRSKLAIEMNRYQGICKFIPVYLVPYKNRQRIMNGIELEIIHTPTLFFSVLWPKNFFRSLYAGVVAYTTIKYWGAHPDNVQLLSVDSRFNESPVLKKIGMVKGFGIKTLTVIGQHRLYRSLMLGLSGLALLDEAEFKVESPGSELRELGYSEFADYLAVDSKTVDKLPIGLLVTRKGKDRNILNEKDLFKVLKEQYGTQIDLRLVCFDDMELEDQIALISQTKLLIAVHGAALAHIMSMKKDSYVLEMFPFGLKKTIYRNLARTFGVNYMSYQVQRPTQTRFLSAGNQCAKQGHVQWYCNVEDEHCMACKHWWRNQSIRVDPKEITKRIDLILPFEAPKHKTENYLLYMPWEQLNNQMIGFKSACALAQYSNRTLVLPPVGYWDKSKAPVEESVGRRRMFNPRHYTWKPFERYFQMGKRLPCRTAPWDAITSLNPKIGRILYPTIGGPDSYWKNITEWFYWETGGMNWGKIGRFPWFSRALHIKRTEVRRQLLPMMNLNMVAVGVMFYFWNFGQVLDYPLKKFVDFMGNKLYRDLVLPFHKDLDSLADMLISCSRSPLLDTEFDAAHVRRGDYREKCRVKGEGELPDRRAMLSCHQTTRYLKSRLALADESRPPVFIATNMPRSVKGATRTIVHQKDLLLGLRLSKPGDRKDLVKMRRAWKTVLFLDNTERAILDQLICIKAPGIFTGNYFSSFTRTISDHRTLKSSRTDFF